MTDAEITDEQLARYQAADKACYNLVLAMSLGGLERVDLWWRRFIVAGGLEAWADLALPDVAQPSVLPRRPRWSSSRPRLGLLSVHGPQPEPW